jgi:hypothetical protein
LSVCKALILCCAAVFSLAAATFFVQPPNISVAQEAKTLKERLSDKASDDQRVDNCRVPPEDDAASGLPDPVATFDARGADGYAPLEIDTGPRLLSTGHRPVD